MPRRRWIALGDLLLAKLRLAEYRLEKLRVAVENTMQDETLEAGEVRVLRLNDIESADSPEKHSVTGAFIRVCKRHEGTPWAKMAEEFLKHRR